MTYLKYIVAVLLLTTFGHSDEWAGTLNKVLNLQADSLFKFSQSKDKEKFAKCFKEYLTSNYSVKEYMNGGSAPALTAMDKCKN